MNPRMGTTVLLATLVLAAPAGAAEAPARAAAKTRTEIRRELDSLGARIDALETRARREGEETRARIGRQVATLRADEGDADRALSRFQAASASARKDLEAAMERAMAKLRGAVRRAEKEAPWNRGSKAP